MLCQKTLSQPGITWLVAPSSGATLPRPRLRGSQATSGAMWWMCTVAPISQFHTSHGATSVLSHIQSAPPALPVRFRRTQRSAAVASTR